MASCHRANSAPIALIVAFFLSGCARSPSRPTDVLTIAVFGSVTDRIDGSSIDGSTITFSGPASLSVPVTRGRYRAEGLPTGAYRITVRGPSHVDHVTENAALTAPNAALDLTVLEWGSGQFGVPYDAPFHDFFNMIGRGAVEYPSPATRRWERPPEEIYVVEEPAEPEAFADALALIREVNQEAVPSMFAGKVAALPVVAGPTPSADLQVPGKIVVSFVDGTTNSGGIACYTSNPYLGNCARVRLTRDGVLRSLASRERRKYLILHEVMHAAGAFHAHWLGTVGGDYARDHDSIMGWGRVGIVAWTLSPVDRFAMWLLNHEGTKPGNTYPDTNPGR